MAELPVEGVDQQAADHHDDRYANATAAKLDEHGDAADAQHHFEGADTGAHHHDVDGINREVHKRPSAYHHEDDVVPRDVVGGVARFFNGIHQVADDYDECQEAGQACLGLFDAEQRHKQAVDRKQNHHRSDDGFRDALPDARVRLAVVLAHDLVDVDVLVGRYNGFIFFDVAFLPDVHLVCSKYAHSSP